MQRVQLHDDDQAPTSEIILEVVSLEHAIEVAETLMPSGIIAPRALHAALHERPETAAIPVITLYDGAGGRLSAEALLKLVIDSASAQVSL